LGHQFRQIFNPTGEVTTRNGWNYRESRSIWARKRWLAVATNKAHGELACTGIGLYYGRVEWLSIRRVMDYVVPVHGPGFYMRTGRWKTWSFIQTVIDISDHSPERHQQPTWIPLALELLLRCQQAVVRRLYVPMGKKTVESGWNNFNNIKYYQLQEVWSIGVWRTTIVSGTHLPGSILRSKVPWQILKAQGKRDHIVGSNMHLNSDLCTGMFASLLDAPERWVTIAAPLPPTKRVTSTHGNWCRQRNIPSLLRPWLHYQWQTTEVEVIVTSR
jgi:hypothetical protein